MSPPPPLALLPPPPLLWPGLVVGGGSNKRWLLLSIAEEGAEADDFSPRTLLGEDVGSDASMLV